MGGKGSGRERKWEGKEGGGKGKGMSVGLKEPWDIPGHIGLGRSLGTSKKSWTLLHGHPRVKWDINF